MFNKKLNYYFICSLLFLILLSNLYLVAKTNIEFDSKIKKSKEHIKL